MPEEYHFTGVSRKFSTSEKATISSNFLEISRRVDAEYRPVEKDVFPPGDLGVKVGPHFQKTTNAPAEHDPPFGRFSDATEDLEKSYSCRPRCARLCRAPHLL
jgi:hypothetical protein